MAISGLSGPLRVTTSTICLSTVLSANMLVLSGHSRARGIGLGASGSLPDDVSEIVGHNPVC